MTSMLRVAAMLGATVLATPALAQTKVAIGISGWTGFAPLTLAKEAGIFAKNGLDVTIKKIPQASRHLAIASGDVQCAATTVETWIVWNANGVATTQMFQLDKSYGADGMVVRSNIASIKDVKGKQVAASAPGTAPYFTLAWFLKKNGLTVKDVTVVNMEPGPAAQAFIAGQNDVAMTYEPYLSAVRASAASRQDHRHHARLSDGDGHVRLHAEIHRRERRGREGAGEELFRRARDDQDRGEEGLRDHGRRREADRRAVRQFGEVSALAGQGRRTRSSSPASTRRSRRRPPTCCWRSASSSRSRICRSSRIRNSCSDFCRHLAPLAGRGRSRSDPGEGTLR